MSPAREQDREQLTRTLDVYRDVVSMQLGRVRDGGVAELGDVLDRALRQAALLASVDPASAELPDALRTAGQAGAAMFALARADGGPIDVPVGGDDVVRLAGSVPGGETHVVAWTRALWAATTVRDFESIVLLAETPADVVRASSGTADESELLLVEALMAFWRGDPAVSERLLAALEATDPERLRPDDAEVVLDLRVPEIELLFRLLDGDAAGFEASLRKALDLHDAFWSRGANRDEPLGLLALGPLALACLAVDGGLAFDVSSPHLPAQLLRSRAPARLALCPYCATPIAPGTERCPACLDDATRDAWLEVSAAEYTAAPRSPCPHCGSWILETAVRCPVCRQGTRG